MDGEPRPLGNKMSSMNADGYIELFVVHRSPFVVHTDMGTESKGLCSYTSDTY